MRLKKRIEILEEKLLVKSVNSERHARIHMSTFKRQMRLEKILILLLSKFEKNQDDIIKRDFFSNLLGMMKND